MTTQNLVITAPAQTDLADIRIYTFDQYGSAGVEAYDAVLKQALRDIRDDPNLTGSKDRSDDLRIEGIRTYHIMHSRVRAGAKVKKPRHLILYLHPKENVVVVLRILHDSRDLIRHLPDDLP